MKWSGNITLEMDGKEDTYSPGSIEVDRYGDESIALKVTSGDERAICSNPIPSAGVQSSYNGTHT